MRKIKFMSLNKALSNGNKHMRHYIFISIFLLFSALTNVFGQDFSDCNVPENVFISAQKGPGFNGSLQEYFQRQLTGVVQDLNGTIYIQILVDSSGKACCQRINNSPSGILSTKLKEIINSMPGWTPAKQNNQPVNFSAVFQFTINNSKLNVYYVNAKPSVPGPIINPNLTNNPDIVKDRKTKVVWKIWNFNNSMIPANLSRNVAVDSNGVIWYCTDNGLVRIVGDDHWQVFNGMNVPALAGRNNTTWTTGLAVDKANNVWVQSFDYIIKYDGRQWTRFDTTNSPLKLVQNICVDRNGTIWFCTFQGLIKYDGNNWTKYNTSNSKIASDNVKDVYIGNNEILWIATDKGINKLENGNWLLLNNENKNIPENDVTSIKGDSLGNIWAGLGTRNKNYLIKIDPANKISVFPSGVIWNITVDNNVGKVWLATNGRGLVSFDGKKFTQYDVSNSIIPNNTVSDLLIDNKGDKWISTFGGLVFTNIK
jgi:hypothetical protein